MLTGNLVRVRLARDRVIPLYINRNDASWLTIAESLLLVFRDSVGKTRGEIDDEIAEMFGDDPRTLAQRGLAKVLFDRADFDVVSELPPETVRETVFTAAAAERRRIHESGRRQPFEREGVLTRVGEKLGLAPAQVLSSLFADLKDENRMLKFDDLDAQRLLDRYNVALAQAVLLRAVLIKVEIQGERPARYRQIFRSLKFHRLLARVEGSMADGYVLHIDGPMSLFSATSKYGLQIALFLPALLLCENFLLTAELEWGPQKKPMTFHVSARDGLVSHHQDQGSYVPAEVAGFVDRFRQIAPEWDVSESTELIELGREGVWVPDYRFVHRPTETDVLLEVLGFWKRTSLERLLRLLPKYGPRRYMLAISDRLKVDDGAVGDLAGPILRFKDVPNASELSRLLSSFISA